MKKQPEVILTDQDPWITYTISKELPITKHTFTYRILPLNLVVDLYQFLIINI